MQYESTKPEQMISTHTDHKNTDVSSQDALVVTWGLMQKYTTHCGVYATTFNRHLQIQQLDETGSSQDWNQKTQCILTQWLHSNVSVHSNNIPGPRLVCISSGTFYSRTAAPCWQKTIILFSGVHYILVFMFVSAKVWPVWAFVCRLVNCTLCSPKHVEFQLKVQVLSLWGGAQAKTARLAIRRLLLRMEAHFHFRVKKQKQLFVKKF